MNAPAAGAALRASLTEQMRRLRGSAPDALVDAVLERVDVPGGPLLRARPRTFDAVREAMAMEGPGHATPYWASAWPAGTFLARAVAADPLAGARVLELGCGLALPSVAAARAGADVLATDAAPEAVVYAAHNLALNDQAGEVAAADWRDLPPAIEAEWDLVLAADVLYRRDNAESLLALLGELLAPGGEAWIADPGRGGCRDFLAGARRRWRVRSTADPDDSDLRLHRLSARRSRSSSPAQPPAARR